MYPSLVTLAGTLIDGKPNWITIAHVGIMTLKTVSLSMRKSRYTNRGIFENKAFSVNLPSVSQRVETDYMGIVSGADVDKSQQFTAFYGELQGAPMIAECPVCMECRLVTTLDFDTHDVFVGEVVQTYANEDVVQGRKIDFAAVQPMLFDFQRVNYWSLGDVVGQAWHDGNVLKK